MPTRMLYREDTYRVDFEAKVIRVEGNMLVLDQTCFYPRGGGQVGDTGEIDGLRVVDTMSDEDLEIIHILEEKAGFKVSDSVHGRVDWERRYRIMRLHSAAHIVYYLMQEVYGEWCKPASSGLLDEKKDRSDYLFTEKLNREKLKEVESRANEIILKGYGTEVWTDEENTRYWKIEPFPKMACGGTHVKNTREIGTIIVKRGRKPGRGRERIEIFLG